MFILMSLSGVLTTMAEKTSKVDLRALAISGEIAKRKSKIVKYEDQEYEVRELTYRERADVLEKCKVVKPDGEQYDGNRILLWAIIRCTYNYREGTRVFEDTDFDVLGSQPTSNPVLRQLTDAVSEMMAGMQEEGLKNASADSDKSQNALQ